MSRVSTNEISLSYAIESSLATLPGSPTWYLLEPNEIGKFGAEITTVARSPISKNRQRRKGAVVDLDSGVEFSADLTISAFMDFMEGFAFAQAVNSEMVIPVTNVDGTDNEYDVAALTSTQAGKLQWESGGLATLVYARGFSNAANNGLKVLDHDPTTSGTAVGVTDSGLVDETPPSNATIELAGVRAKTGDLAITVSGGVATLTNGNNAVTSGLDFSTLGLTIGQFIHVGGLTGSNQFSAGVGYGRITALSANSITLDKLSGTLATDNGSGDTVDLLFGRFVRNVTTDHASYINRSFQFEMALPDLDSVGTDEYMYAKGNYCNEMTINLPLVNKATVDFNFIGTDTENPTTSRKTNASSARNPTMTEAVGTSSDIARLRITKVDETGLMTDFKNVEINLKNNVSADKIIGTLGAVYMNTGIFEVDISATALFTEGDVVTAMRANTTVSMDWAVENSDGSLWFDVPSLTISNGAPNYPVNEAVQIEVTGMAFQHATLGTSFSVSVFAITP